MPCGRRFVAALQNLRQPIVPPERFGPRPSLSFFLLSADGQQAMPRLFLDAVTVPMATGAPALSTGAMSGANVAGDPSADHVDQMQRYVEQDCYDDDTNGPSRNFIYDFSSVR